jgi:hypothetical protein
LITTQSGPNTVKQGRMCKTYTEQEREEGSDDSDHVLCDSHGGEGLDVEELLHNIECKELLENKKRGFDKLEIMEKMSKELLYDESKGCDTECIVF